jgi:NTE family protein
MLRRVSCMIHLLTILMISGSVHARPRVGLVLSGGGARGVAHAGVLKVLEELRIPIDCITGTSMGAIVGGLYASGYSPVEIDSIARAIDWDDVFDDDPKREKLSYTRKKDDRDFLLGRELGFRNWRVTLPGGIVSGQKLDFTLKALTVHVAHIDSFDRLHVPFRTVAADVVSGEAVVFDHGSLASAIRASMSVPGYIAPVEIGGRKLIDGGIVDNLPVGIARKMGAETLIAVNVGTQPMKEEQVKSVLDLTIQTYLLLSEQNVRESIASLDSTDVLIRPDLSGVSASDFDGIPATIDQGEIAARKAITALRRLSVPKVEYAAFLHKQRRQKNRPITIDMVQVKGTEHIPVSLILRRMKTRPGDLFNAKTLREDIEALQELGELERVEFTLIRFEGRNLLLIEAVEKSWGPGFLRFGMQLSDNLEGESHFNVSAQYRRTWVNRLGAEWKTRVQIGQSRAFKTEIYQPLTTRGTWYVQPHVRMEESPTDFYDNMGTRIARYNVKLGAVAFDIGRMFGRWGELAVGVEKGRGKPEILIGTIPGFTGATVNRAVVYARARYDQLDDVNFPTDGRAISGDIYFSRDELGGDENYQFGKVSFLSAKTHRRYTVILSGDAGFPLKGSLPHDQQFTVGGLMNLSGYGAGQFTGNYFGMGRVGIRRAFGSFSSPTYVGVTGEVGNAWASRGDISPTRLRIGSAVFLGMDTVIGPLYLATGMGRSLDSFVYKDWSYAFYLYLGRGF